MFKNFLLLCSFFVLCGCNVETRINPIDLALYVNWYLTVCQVQPHTLSNSKDKPFSLGKMSFLYKTYQLDLEPDRSEPGTWSYDNEKTCYKRNISSITNPNTIDKNFSNDLPFSGVVMLRFQKNNNVQEKI
jgi:hypothetical protein